MKALLDAAGEAFLEQGFDAPKINDIVNCVGGSLRNVYIHFGGKDGLFEASIKRLCDRITDQMHDDITPSKPLEENLKTLGMRFVRFAVDPRALALHRLMIAEAKRFPSLSMTIYISGHSRAAAATALVIQDYLETTGTRLRGGITPAALGQMFVHMAASEIQLKALVTQDFDASDRYERHINDCVGVLMGGFLNQR